MIDVLGVAMGIDLQGFSREEGSDDLPPGLRKTSAPSPPQSPTRAQSTPSSSASNSKPTPPPAPEPEKEDVELSEEDAEEAKAKADALAEKEKGSEYYKQRRFDEAASAFSNAWDLWPKDITFLTNLGAAYFEQGEYDKCIETCEKAVEEGRNVRFHPFINLGEYRVGRNHARYSTVPISSFSQRLSDVSAQPIRTRATSHLPKSTSKSRLLSTAMLSSSASSRPPKKRSRRVNDKLTLTPTSLLPLARKVTSHSRQVTLQAQSSFTRKASSATLWMLEVTITVLQRT